MATMSVLNPTLADLAARMEGDSKKIATVIELLKQQNAILEDMSWVQCNDGTNHRTTVRSGLPSVAWRLLNYGVQPSKSQTVQAKDACGMLMAYAEVDKKLADLNGNTAEFRLSEDIAFIQAMNHELSSALFYANINTDPSKIMGLAPRFSALTGADNSANVINAGGTGSDNTSIWFVVWGPQTIHGIYPKGSTAGLQHTDEGEVTLEDTNKGKYPGYRTRYEWDCGLTLRDWRGVSRVANIDVSALALAGETAYAGASLPNLMIKAYNKIRRYMALGRTVIYANETVLTALDLLASNKANTWFTTDNGIDGKQITRFRGIPIKLCDALLDTEEAVA